MNDKTTQELREEHIRDILMWHLEQDKHNVDILMEAINSYAKTLIAKHEAELVEKVVNKFITASLEALDETNGEFINYDKLLAEKFAKVADELTALTEKESKE